MTDFLTNIAARSFGEGTAIRPRLTSLFEPLHSRGVVLELDSTRTETASTVEAESRTPESRHRDSVTAKPVKPVETMRIDRSSDKLAAVREPVSEQWRESKPHMPVFPKQALEVHDQAPAPPDVQEEDSKDPPAERTARHRIVRVEPESVVVRQPVLTPLDISQPAAEKLQPDYRGLLVPTRTASRVGAELRNSLAPMSTRQVPPRKEVLLSGAAREQDIHVTIGRIEVRATPESAPARASRATSSVMSLDEYLQRRAQRGGH